MRIIQPIMHSVLHGAHIDETCLDEKSFALLKEIQKTLSVFEPINDDETRMIWLEIPRGTAEEMMAWDNDRFGCSEDEDNDLQSYQDILAEDYPREKEWFFLTTSTYRESSFLKISDRCHQYTLMTNRNQDGRRYGEDMTWFLEPLLDLVKSRVAEIVQDPDAYNRHVESDLPYRQRSGRIRSRDLNAILPERRLEVENREYCISVMKDLIRREQLYKDAPEGAGAEYWKENNLPEPFDEMTIRKFCHYYRIADTILRKESEYPSRHDRNMDDIADDVEYYKKSGLHYGKLDGFDLDSVADFDKFANDHYGELGLSRMNVHGTDYYVKGGKWIVTFGISYSAYVDTGLNIAIALYESGAPFIYHDAENTLHVLEETGWVRISPWTFHDYLGNEDDEGVISIPFDDECGNEDEMSLDQLQQIVKKAVWQKPTKVRLDKTIPYEDLVYDSVRDKLQSPSTLSEIRHAIEEKYDTYLAVVDSYKGRGFHYMTPRLRSDRDYHTRESKDTYPTFNEAMYALILKFNEYVKEKNHENTIHE